MIAETNIVRLIEDYFLKVLSLIEFMQKEFDMR